MLAALLLGACGDGLVCEADPAAGEPSQPVAEPVDGWDDLLPNPRRPEPGLLSGGQPTLEQLAAARDLGFQSVINLRGEGEPGAGRAEVEDLGLAYLSVPIEGAAGLSEENARAFAAALAAAERPAIVHCGSGNRIGALFALKAFYVDGMGADEAYELGQRNGLTRLSGAVRRHLDQASQSR